MVSIANDTPVGADYRVLYRYMDFSGKVLDEKTLSAHVDKTEDADVLVLDTPFTHAAADKLVYLRLTDPAGNILSENVYQHCADRDIVYPAANIRVTAVDANTVELVSDTFAKNVFLQCGSTAKIYSDNFFHLLPGEPKRITCAEPLDMDALTTQCVNQVRFSEKGGDV